MTDRLATGDFRLLAPRETAGSAPADGDDLANLDTTNLPNHVMCWAADTLYQLDKSMSGSTLIVDGVALSVAPNSGPGLWVPIAGEAAIPLTFVINQPTVGSGALTGSTTVIAYPNLNWVIQGATSILPLTLDNDGCVLTNTGPDRWFYLRAYVSYSADSTNNPGLGRLFLYQNGLSGTQRAIQSAGYTDTTLSNLFVAMVATEAKVLLAEGDTIQPAVSNGNTDDFAVGQFTWAVQELTDTP